MKSRLGVKDTRPLAVFPTLTIAAKKLPPSEYMKKLECHVKSQEKKLAAQAGRFPETTEQE